MHADEVASFFARPAEVEAEDHIELDYTFECVGDPRAAAASLCAEQSTAQWRRPGVDEDLRRHHAARVLEFDAVPRPGGFSLPLSVAPHGAVHECRATIALPHRNFGPRIPNMLSAILGEGTFFSPGVPIVRLEDVRFPRTFLAQFEGPRLGVSGLREILRAHGRPIFIGVVKPNIGLPPEAFAELAYEGWRGGLDIAKDDELLADAPWSPLAERASQVRSARARAESETRTPKIYLANITDEVERIPSLYDEAVGAGANAVMLNAIPVGLSAARMLRKRSTVPLFAHFPMIAAFSRVPGHGVHSRVFTRLQRLAGFDAIIMPGFGDRMMTPAAEVLENVRACTEPMGDIRPSLPVPGGGDSADTLARVHREIGHADFGFICGRGVFAHPDGPAAGARAVRTAWDAIAR